jgi:hypothetical protein
MTGEVCDDFRAARVGDDDCSTGELLDGDRWRDVGIGRRRMKITLALSLVVIGAFLSGAGWWLWLLARYTSRFNDDLRAVHRDLSRRQETHRQHVDRQVDTLGQRLGEVETTATWAAKQSQALTAHVAAPDGGLLGRVARIEQFLWQRYGSASASAYGHDGTDSHQG